MLAPFIFLISAILAIGTFMYVIIMGPSPYHRNGCVGMAYRVLKKVPIVVGGVCCSVRFCCNQRKGRAACTRCCNHTMRERNWFMVIFYIVLVWSVEILYLLFALPKLNASWLSKGVSWGLVLVSEMLYARAVFADPGKVTSRNEQDEHKAYTEWRKSQRHGATVATGTTAGKPSGAKRAPHRKTQSPTRAMPSWSPSPKLKRDGPPRWPKWHLTIPEEYILNRRYCVDGMLYALAGDDVITELGRGEAEFTSPEGTVVGVGQMCSTCSVHRPARSKHCSLCNMCVRRYDHHCPWINNDVAEGTHRYFLGFLIVHGVSCSWASVDLYRCIKQYLISRRAWGWVLYGPGGKVFRLRFVDYMAIVVNYCMLEACLFFFAVCISLVLYGFWAYQMSFVMSNLTMNDLNKLEDVARFVAELPSLDLVLREARRVKARLDTIALRKPVALLKLEDLPAEVKTDLSWAEGGKKNNAYRKKVRKMIIKDLYGLYDRGRWGNIMEVLFPYAILTRERVAAAEAVLSTSQ